jgi:hypothetical protein
MQASPLQNAPGKDVTILQHGCTWTGNTPPAYMLLPQIDFLACTWLTLQVARWSFAEARCLLTFHTALAADTPTQTVLPLLLLCKGMPSISIAAPLPHLQVLYPVVREYQRLQVAY